jgi:hypothetical protein
VLLIHFCRLLQHVLVHNENLPVALFSIYMDPNAGIGQTLNTIFPTIISSDIQPTVLLLESTDTDRLSPIINHLFSGT